MDLNRLPTPPRPQTAPTNPLYPSPRPSAWGTVSTVLVAMIAALSVTVLGACGGGGESDSGEGRDSANAAAAVGTVAPAAQAGQAAQTQASVDFKLESEYGPGEAPGATTRLQVAAAADVADRAAAPVDRQARTRGGRYVSRAVAERQYAETGGQVVWVDASCCAGLDPELPERIAFGMQAVLGDEAPLYVSGTDLRQAARLADRLHGLGLGRVYLVTP